MKKCCKNTLCRKLFDPMNRGSKKTVYCSSSCSDIARMLRAGQIRDVDDFEEGRKGFLKLRNGVEIRNDVIGKEISNPLLVVSR